MTIKDKIKELKATGDSFARFSDGELEILYRTFSNYYSNAGTFYHELTTDFVESFQKWVDEKVPEVEPITYENAMKKLDKYFANVSDEQFEEDLKKAGCGSDIEIELTPPVCDASDCSLNEDGKCGVRPYINITSGGTCLDYEALREEEDEPEVFFGENIRSIIKNHKEVFQE